MLFIAYLQVGKKALRPGREKWKVLILSVRWYNELEGRM